MQTHAIQQQDESVQGNDLRAEREIDPAKLEAFLGRVLGELGATHSAHLVRIGDELGLYRALADGEPVTPAELAAAHSHGEHDALPGSDERPLIENGPETDVRNH